VSESLDLPLHLFQVLEEEHISLHGQLEQETVISFKDRKVTSALDWQFHQGHIKDWEKFKRHLQTPDLNVSARLKQLLAREKVATWRTEADAIASLDKLLEEDFYRPNEFGHLKFSSTTEKLCELYPKKQALQKISPDELRRLNRFLLEDLFPEYLERVREIRLAAIYQHQHDQQSVALCLSGGGIRSGTFALGLLQGLARHSLLERFDYLSTVSGGGYIGGWLTAWIHRHPQPDKGLEGVTKDLTNARPGLKIDPDPAPIRHLREYSNFLTPKAGLMSTDTWTFLAIYVRNLLLNWSVIIPLILAFLLIPRFCVAAILANPPEPFVESLKHVLPSQLGGFLSSIEYLNQLNLRHIFLLVGFICASWAIAYMAVSRPGFRSRLIERNPRWKDGMGQRGFLKYCLAPLVSAAVLLTTYSAWTQNNKKLGYFLVFGLVTASFGLLWSIYVVKGWRNWRDFGIVAPLMVLLAGGLGGLFVALARPKSSGRFNVLPVDDTWATELYVVTAVPLFMLMFLLAVTVFAGISSHFVSRVTDEDREWWARFSAWVLICALAWAVFSSLVIFGPLLLLAFPTLVGGIGGLAGIVAFLAGRSAKTAATPEQVAQGGFMAKLQSQLLPGLAVIFIAVFVATLSLATSKLTRPASTALHAGITTANVGLGMVGGAIPEVWGLDHKKFNAEFTGPSSDWFKRSRLVNVEADKWIPGYIEHMRAIHLPRWWSVLLMLTLLMLIGFGLARVINLNLFSLHNGYRNRLIRGFLAASRDNQLRRPNPFTGFDPADNVSMHELRPALLHEVDFIDLEGFANQLKMGGEALATRSATTPTNQNQPSVTNKPQTASEFLYKQLSDRGKVAADSAGPAAALSQSQRVDLREDLNRILEADQIKLWNEPGFAQPPPAPAQQPPAQSAPRQEYHIHRNRRALEQTYPQYIVPSNYPPHRLLHVVNTTLNLVGGDNLAWQQRKAESFTVSPLHSGSYRVGYRRSKDYGGDDGISLGTAMAISGAAASSNMGYYTTSPVLSLLLTLFNVRLGWWLGNPGPAGSHSYYIGLKSDDLRGEPSKKIYRRMSPTFSVTPVFHEAFGLTDDRNNYVYLTDGGHFENLGLYEMVLRRCHLIVVSDAAADAKYEFNDLANAVRKVRIDLGIHIEFPDVPIYSKAPDKDEEGGCYWTLGLIRYSDIDRQDKGEKAKDGVLIYIKPAIYGDEPEDVIHYRRTHPTFPNETTADQFFDEPQFESYRALGSYIMDQMCGSHSGELDLVQFREEVYKNFLSMAPQVKDKYREFWPSKTDHTTIGNLREAP
jgi:hypothetical protein